MFTDSESVDKDATLMVQLHADFGNAATDIDKITALARHNHDVKEQLAKLAEISRLSQASCSFLFLAAMK
jgi:hypothetical protein